MIRAAAIAAGIVTIALAASHEAVADDRVVSVEYVADQIVRVDGRIGVQATIGFDDGERIENVAVGDSGKWQITPNKRADLLFVKPLVEGARTNMTVVTSERTYLFDLVASEKAQPVYLMRFTYGGKDGLASREQPARVAESAQETFPGEEQWVRQEALAVLADELAEDPEPAPAAAPLANDWAPSTLQEETASGPEISDDAKSLSGPKIAADEPRLAAVEAAPPGPAEQILTEPDARLATSTGLAEETPARPQVASDPVAAPPSAEMLASTAAPSTSGGPANNGSPMLNFAWVRNGEADLMPSRIYDDGAATYLQWHNGNAVPSILTRDASGGDAPVYYRVEGYTVVIDYVPEMIVLQSGEMRGTLENRAAGQSRYAAQMQPAPPTTGENF